MSKFKDVFQSLSHKIVNVLLQEYVPPPPAPLPLPATPPPAPPPAPIAVATSLTESQERAISQIIEIASDDWLSDIQVGAVINAFRRDNTLSEVFLIFLSSKELSAMQVSSMRSWIHNHVLKKVSG